MEKILKPVGDLAAVVGLLTCLISGVARITSHYQIAGFEALTLFTMGVAAMVVSILAKVQIIQNQK